MNMNKPDHLPGNEREILIAFDNSGETHFISGHYYFSEKDYYDWYGNLIEMTDMIGWDDQPTIEFISG